MDNLDQDGGDVVPGGTYTTEVVDARPIEGKSTIWLDLKIVGGPDDGRVVSVTCNVPDDNSSRGAIFFFKKKVRGFNPQLVAANLTGLSDDEVPAAIAEAVLGVTVESDLSVQTGGDYDGSQQLDETRQLVDIAAPAAAAAPPAAPEAPPAAAPAAPAPQPAAPAAAPEPVTADLPF